MTTPALHEIANQGIVDSTGTDSFAKETKLVKLFQELDSMPMQCHEKGLLVFLVFL